MKELLNIKDNTLGSRSAAEKTQLPLCIKLEPTRASKAKAINVYELLTFGSSDGCGLEALFAYELMRGDDDCCCSTKKLADISAGNLGTSLYTRANLDAIIALLPKNSDGVRLLDWLVINREAKKQPLIRTNANDFRFFHHNISLDTSKVEVTDGKTTLACIYKFLQESNHIVPDPLIQGKIAFILHEKNS